MYNASITIDDKQLLDVLKAEDNWDKDRSSLKITGNKIIIEAQDIIAFKATVNGLIKLIEAYEKASSVIQNDNE